MVSLAEEMLLEEYPLVRATRQCAKLGIRCIVISEQKMQEIEEELRQLNIEILAENILRQMYGEPPLQLEQVPIMDVRVVNE